MISLRQDLERDGEAEVERILQQILQLPQFSEQPRLAQSWALILYFTFKVSLLISAHLLIVIEPYMKSRWYAPVGRMSWRIMACVTLNSTATEEGTDKTSSLESVVTDTVREVLEYCNGKVIRQVIILLVIECAVVIPNSTCMVSVYLIKGVSNHSYWCSEWLALLHNNMHTL